MKLVLALLQLLRRVQQVDIAGEHLRTAIQGEAQVGNIPCTQRTAPKESQKATTGTAKSPEVPRQNQCGSASLPRRGRLKHRAGSGQPE